MDDIKQIFTDGLSIVIPAYNEDGRIGNSIERILEYLAEKEISYEIIVVDDCSRNRVSGLLDRYSADNFRVVRNERNRGKGYSVKRGILEAKYPWVLFSDADLATPIEEIEKFAPFIDRYDIIIASRNMKKSDIKVKQPFYRQFLGRMFPLLVNLLAVRGIRDTQCGFKLFNTDAAQRIVRKQTIERFSFDVELLFLARKYGYRIKEVAVVWVDQAGSKVDPLKDSVRMFKDLMRIRWNSLVGRY